MGLNEFVRHDGIPWQRITDTAWEKILYRDETSGTYVRLLRFDPGNVTSDVPMTHEFDEFVYILEGGEANVKAPDQPYTQGMYAVFPAGTPHGPFVCENGAVFVEFRHFKPRGGSKQA